MQVKQLNVADVLKYARHDFLNELQMILMNIDLGHPEKAREMILTTTNKMRQHSILSSLKLPETAIWLMTFEWMYPSFSKQLSCQIKAPIVDVDDDELVSVLKKIIAGANEHVNIYSNYEAIIDVYTNQEEWEITVRLEGKLPALVGKVRENTTLMIEESLQENLWKFTIRGQ